MFGMGSFTPIGGDYDASKVSELLAGSPVSIHPRPQMEDGIHEAKRARVDDDEAALFDGKTVDAMFEAVVGLPSQIMSQTIDTNLKEQFQQTNAIEPAAVNSDAPALTKRQQQDKAFEAAIVAANESGQWNQAALGNKFQRTFGAKGPRHKEYQRIQGLANIEQFKKDWISDKNKEIQKTKTYLKGYQRVDRRHGKYVPVGQYIESFGIHYDREGAIKAGLRGAQKMVKMGGEWCYIDTISETLYVLLLERQFMEDPKESWELSTKETTTGTSSSAASSSDTQVADVVLPAVSGQQGKEAATPKPAAKVGKAKAKGKAPADKVTPPNKLSKTETDIAITDANGLKERYLKVSGRAEQVKGFILEESGGWGWANNDKDKKILAVPLKDITDEIAKDGDVQTYVSKDAKEFNKKFGKEHIAYVARKFLDLGAKVRRLEKAVTKMNDLWEIENRASQE